MRDDRPDRTRAPWALPLGLIAAFWIFDLAVLRAGTPDPLDDLWEYGAVARSLLQGHGFRTPVIHPPLWSLRDAASTVPVLVHGPLLPVVLAPLVAIAGPGVLDHAAWLAALFATLAALTAYRLGARTMGVPVGAAAAGLVTLSPLMLRAVHHDIALTCGAWLLALALDQLLRTRAHANRAGIALGIGMLVRPEFGLALPLLAPLAGGAAGRFALVTLAIASPWMLHTFLATGSPFFNLSSYLAIGYWGPRPGIAVMRDFALAPHAWPHALAQALPTLPAKWLDFFPHAFKRLIFTPSDATGWLAPLGALAAVQSPRSRPLAWVAAALALVPLAIMTVTLYDARYLTPFLVPFALGAARGAAEVVEWLPAWGRTWRAWTGLLALLLLVTSGPALNDAWREGRDARARLATERPLLLARAAAAAPGAIVFTDTPDFAAFTTRHPALWLSRPEYDALPVSGDARERPLRRAGDWTWFHDAEGRGPAEAVAAAAQAAARRRTEDSTRVAADSARAAVRRDSLEAREPKVPVRIFRSKPTQ